MIDDQKIAHAVCMFIEGVTGFAMILGALSWLLM